ncbi:hypothetical protein BSKO_12996 [Bryopsis sp. KO-2023]|nr:hypothetical protein BSKO_12996 [Bryopsis sp. KO-2023]
MLGSSIQTSQLVGLVGVRQNARPLRIGDAPRGERILSRNGGVQIGGGCRDGLHSSSVAARALAESIDLSTHEAIRTVESPEDLEELLKSEEMVVLQCKARACRPCKAFRNKFTRIAGAYPDVVFAQVTGDESTETRRMMMKMKVTTTPSFFLFSDGKEAHRFSGANKEKLVSAIDTHLLGCSDDESVDGSMDDGNFSLNYQGA